VFVPQETSQICVMLASKARAYVSGARLNFDTVHYFGNKLECLFLTAYQVSAENHSSLL